MLPDCPQNFRSLGNISENGNRKCSRNISYHWDSQGHLRCPETGELSLDICLLKKKIINGKKLKRNDNFFLKKFNLCLVARCFKLPTDSEVLILTKKFVWFINSLLFLLPRSSNVRTALHHPKPSFLFTMFFYVFLFSHLYDFLYC